MRNYKHIFIASIVIMVFAVTAAFLSIIFFNRITHASTMSSLNYGVALDLHNSGDRIFTSSAQTDVKNMHVQFIRIPYNTGIDNATMLKAMQTVKTLNAVPQVILDGPEDSNFVSVDSNVVSMAKQVFGSSAVYFTFGNEPDALNINEGVYVSSWNYIIPVLRGIYPGALFGGPELSIPDTAYMSSFLRDATSSPDFISWHEFPCQIEDSSAACISKLSTITADIGNMKHILAGNPNNIKMVIDSWGFNLQGCGSGAQDVKCSDGVFQQDWVKGGLQIMGDNNIWASAQASLSDDVNQEGMETPAALSFGATYTTNASSMVNNNGILSSIQASPTPLPHIAQVQTQPAHAFVNITVQNRIGETMFGVKTQNNTALSVYQYGNKPLWANLGQLSGNSVTINNFTFFLFENESVGVGVTASDGNIWVNQETSQDSSSWKGWQNLGHPSSVSFAASVPVATIVSDVHGTQHIFAIGDDGNIWDIWGNSKGVWSTWDASHNLGNPAGLEGSSHTKFNPQLTVETDLDGRMELFLLGTDDMLWRNWQTASVPSGSWKGWTNMKTPQGVKLGIDPAGKETYIPKANYGYSGQLEFLVGGSDGNIWYLHEGNNPGGWTNWTSLPHPKNTTITSYDLGHNFSIPLRISQTQLAAFASDGKIYLAETGSTSLDFANFSTHFGAPKNIPLQNASLEQENSYPPGGQYSEATLIVFIPGASTWENFQNANTDNFGQWVNLGQPK